MDLNPSSLKGLSELVVVILGAVLITRTVFYAIIELAKLWRDAVKERNLIDEKRNQIDEKNVAVLDQITLRLEKLHVADRDTQDTMTREHQATRERVVQHDSKVDKLVTEFKEARDIQYQALQTQLDTISNRLENLTNCTKDIPEVVKEVKAISKIVDEIINIIKQEGEV